MRGWFEVSETFATRSPERRMGYRLLTKKSLSPNEEALFYAATLV